VAPAEQAELRPEQAEVAFLRLDLANQLGEVRARRGVAVSRPRQAADLLLQAPALRLERQGAGIAVGQRPLETFGVVAFATGGEEIRDLLEERIVLHRTPVFAFDRRRVWAASPIFRHRKT